MTEEFKKGTYQVEPPNILVLTLSNSIRNRGESHVQQGKLVRIVRQTRLLPQVPLLLASHRLDRSARNADQVVRVRVQDLMPLFHDCMQLQVRDCGVSNTTTRHET